MNSSAERLFAAVDVTWPAADTRRQGAFLLRDGQGGGKRVSAASALSPAKASDIDEAEADMAAAGQRPIFMLRPEDAALDTELAARGYAVVDPVTVLACPIDTLTDRPVPPVTAFCIWEPLAIMEEIWAQGGIGPARLAVMHRAQVKTAVFGRHGQRPAGVGFVAVDREIAMVHAVEVLPDQRRQGVAQWIMRQAGFWAKAQGATTMAVLCTKANTAALQLYSSLGFQPVSEYHYRQQQPTKT
jgi:GNAT superfamily N-acetyltransferase